MGTKPAHLAQLSDAEILLDAVSELPPIPCLACANMLRLCFLFLSGDRLRVLTSSRRGSLMVLSPFHSASQTSGLKGLQLEDATVCPAKIHTEIAFDAHSRASWLDSDVRLGVLLSYLPWACLPAKLWESMKHEAPILRAPGQALDCNVLGLVTFQEILSNG